MILLKLFIWGAGATIFLWLMVGFGLVLLAASEAWPAVLAAIALMFYVRGKERA